MWDDLKIMLQWIIVVDAHCATGISFEKNIHGQKNIRACVNRHNISRARS